MAIESTADYVRMTRGVLAAAGFVRRSSAGVVWWTHDTASACAMSCCHPERRVEGLGWEGHQELMLVAPPNTGPSTHARDDRATFVLIHGANDHAGTWFSVAPALTAHARVIIPDLAGHGESAPEAGPIPISLIVMQLEAILSGEGELHLVGNSMGGWIALLFALKNPERVARLFLETSGGLERPAAVPLVAGSRDEALNILRAVHGPLFQPPEWVIQSLLERAHDSPMLRLAEVSEHSVEARLGDLRMPATLIWGAEDGVVPLAYGEALRDAIPGSTLRVIEGAAHIPHLQQPKRFLECLTATF